MAARLPTPDLFKGLHFDHEVVILCVRWYVTYKLSSRDLVSMTSNRSRSTLRKSGNCTTPV